MKTCNMVKNNTMHHTNLISAAMGTDWDSGCFVDGKAENDYSAFYWSIYKGKAHIDVKYDVASASVEVMNVSVKRKKRPGPGSFLYPE